MTKIFYIHIGNHKTGTTAIQTFLNFHNKELKSHGIEYPQVGSVSQYPNHNHNIAWELCNDNKFSSKFLTLNNLYKFMSKCNNNIIISSEDLEILDFDNIKFNELKKNIKKNNFTIKIILFLRNQIDYFSGFYQTILLLGYAALDLERLWMGLEKDDYFQLHKVRFWFDYNKQIKQIKQIFNISNNDIICQSYDENKNNLLQNFLKILNIKRNNFNYKKFKSINPAITILSKTMLEFFNKNHLNFNLNFNEKQNIINTLINEKIFKGERYKLKNKKLNSFMINRFTNSNKIVEDQFNISINKFLQTQND